jgi:hypothetical protein
VQNYVDHDPGPGAADYRCGRLAYDGHKGTDIRIIDLAAYKRGIPVLAAAPGRVRAIRDAMPDASVREAGKASVTGREAGNSVVLVHDGGWETQYAHLRRGSIAVRAGERVETGQRLGMTGLSGNTEFPHLHFEVRQGGRTVDPFVGTQPGARCEPGRAPLWARDALSVLPYVATGILGAGISGSRPRLSASSVDPELMEPFRAASPIAVLWVQIYGAQEGDVEELRLIAPNGRVLAERQVTVSRNMAQSLSYVGLERRAGGWSAGAYRGEYVVYRGRQREKVVSLVLEASPQL